MPREDKRKKVTKTKISEKKLKWIKILGDMNKPYIECAISSNQLCVLRCLLVLCECKTRRLELQSSLEFPH